MKTMTSNDELGTLSTTPRNALSFGKRGALLIALGMAGAGLLFTGCDEKKTADGAKEEYVYETAENDNRDPTIVVGEQPGDVKESGEAGVVAEGTTADPGTVQVPAAAGETIVLVTTMGEQPESFVGRALKLDGLEVTRVVGDVSFYVRPKGEADSKEYLVMLDEKPTPNSPVEGRYRVRQGDTIGLAGEVRALDMDKITQQDDMLDKAEVERMKQEKIYLYAESLSGVEVTAK